MRRRRPASASRRRARRSGTSSRPPSSPPYGSYPNPLPWAPCGYKPDQLRNAYGVTGVLASGIDGSGVTVAIVDAYASPTIVSDATTYAQRNDPDPPVQEVEVLPEGLPAVLRRRPQQVRRVGLVRRGDPRRRGRAHDGPGRQHLLRRRQELQQRRLHPGAERPGRRAQGRHRLQLVRRVGESTPADCGPTRASTRRPRSRASASTSPPATVATRPTPAMAVRSRPPTSRPPRRS